MDQTTGPGPAEQQTAGPGPAEQQTAGPGPAKQQTAGPGPAKQQTAAPEPAGQQIAEAMAAERESLSVECRSDAARLERLLAPDFHEFGSSGREYGFEATAAMVAAATDPGDEPIRVADMRGWLLADGLVMLKYTSTGSGGMRAHRTSLWRRTAPGRWQIFHHQGTPAPR